MIVLVMGVSGSGKTTVGERLAAELGWRYVEADDHHSPQNVAKMAAGLPLDDADRAPWLQKINAELVRIEKQGHSAVLGCSALKEAYRRRLAQDVADFRTVFLEGSYELIRERVEARRHRYMPASLLKSQFETLEPPQRAIVVDISGTADQAVAQIKARLGFS